MIGHDGGTAGTATFFRIAPDQQGAWAFAATGAGGISVYRRLDPLLRKHFGIAAAPTRIPPGGPAPRDLSAYCGRYSRYGMTFDITKADNGLSISTGGAMAPRVIDRIELRPLTAQVFEARLPRSTRRFGYRFTTSTRGANLRSCFCWSAWPGGKALDEVLLRVAQS